MREILKKNNFYIKNRKELIYFNEILKSQDFHFGNPMLNYIFPTYLSYDYKDDNFTFSLPSEYITLEEFKNILRKVKLKNILINKHF